MRGRAWRSVDDLLYGDPQRVETTTQDRLSITTEPMLVSVVRSEFPLCTCTHGPSPRWHIAVLPGAISRLCSVSSRQIPVWDTDTPPHLSQTPAPARPLRSGPPRFEKKASSQPLRSTQRHEASPLIKLNYIHRALPWSITRPNIWLQGFLATVCTEEPVNGSMCTEGQSHVCLVHLCTILSIAQALTFFAQFDY